MDRTGTVAPPDPPRASRARRLRRRRIRRRLLGGLLIAALGAGGGYAALSGRTGPAGPGADPAEAPAPIPQQTLLVVTTLGGDLSFRAESLALLALPAEGERPVVLFLPTLALGEIPGEGFDQIGKAYSIGGGSLQRLTVQNLLGVRVDGVLAFDDQTLAEMIDAVGGIDIEVAERLTRRDADGRVVTAFAPGPARFDGPTAIEYFHLHGEGGSELGRFPRMQAVWEGFFARLAPDPERTASLLREFAPSLVSTLPVEEVERFLGGVAAAPPSQRTFDVLPVVPAGGPGEAYRLDDGRAAEIAERLFAGARLGGGEAHARVEVRNGNGRPHSARAASARLIEAGLRIVLTGNAPSFDIPRTRIVVYDDDEASLALAERVRGILGLGEVTVNRRAQSVVDVTVVVGLDFLDRLDGAQGEG